MSTVLNRDEKNKIEYFEVLKIPKNSIRPMVKFKYSERAAKI